MKRALYFMLSFEMHSGDYLIMSRNKKIKSYDPEQKVQSIYFKVKPMET